MLALANVCELAETKMSRWIYLGGKMGNKPGKNPLKSSSEQQKHCLRWLSGFRLAVSRVQMWSSYPRNVLTHAFDATWRSPGKYLRDCCSQSHWRCCIQTDWEARASPAGGRGLLGASYWGHQEAVQTDNVIRLQHKNKTPIASQD